MFDGKWVKNRVASKDPCKVGASRAKSVHLWGVSFYFITFNATGCAQTSRSTPVERR